MCGTGLPHPLPCRTCRTGEDWSSNLAFLPTRVEPHHRLLNLTKDHRAGDDGRGQVGASPHVHEGFLEAFSSCLPASWDDLEPMLRTINQVDANRPPWDLRDARIRFNMPAMFWLGPDYTPDMPVYVCGHSLGGALAVLCAAQLASGSAGCDDSHLERFHTPRAQAELWPWAPGPHTSWCPPTPCTFPSARC